MRSLTAMTLRLLTPLVLVLPATPALAQGPVAPAAPRVRGDWRFSPTLGSDAEYDDNIYLLSSSKKSRIDAPNGADLASGRYANMSRPGDLITTLRAAIEMRGPGLAGRALTITPEAAYELYAWNAERRTERFGLTVAQALPHSGRVRLQADVTPSTFYKNYLADAVDTDGSGSITSDERRYGPGSYAERALTADVRLRLVKQRTSRPVGLALQVGAGYSGRSYDAPFETRDLSGPSGALGLLFDVGKKVEMDLGYELASLGATPGRVVMLLDENDFGVDFNGNGNASDVDARAFEMVDRSRTEQGISLAFTSELSKSVDLALEYGRRWRSFGSDQPYDVSNNGRHDARNELGLGLRVELTSAIRLNGTLQYQKQSIDRVNDPAGLGDEDDYTRLRTSIGLRWTH